MDYFTYWSFYLLVPLIVGWSALCCVTGLTAFFHLDLSLGRPRFRCFLRRSALTTSFHLNFGLPRHVGQSALKLMIFFNDDVSCRYKWSDSLGLFHLRTSSIWWTRILLHWSSVECFCSVLTFLNQRIIASSHLLWQVFCRQGPGFSSIQKSTSDTDLKYFFTVYKRYIFVCEYW